MSSNYLLFSFFFIIKMENTLHHHPFPITCGIRVTFLELGDESLPLCLSGKGGKPCHCLVPIKVKWCLDNHYKPRSQEVNVHLKNSHFAYAFKYFWPRLSPAVGFLVSCYQFRVILEIHCLHIPFHWLCILLHLVSRVHFSPPFTCPNLYERNP